MMGKIVGIDLGTTNCCVAVYDEGRTRVLASPQGSRTTPSVVAVSEDGDRLVGQIAKRQSITNPENTVFAVKRLIGRKLDSPEVKALAEQHLPYRLSEADNGDVRVKIGGQDFSPPEISSMILAELKSYAEKALGEDIEEAIITVPAYFDDAQRQATKDAGRIAGLEVRRIINEPTAAALAYGLDQAEGQSHVAVFDLGGGTFDISILEIADGVLEVKATNGHSDLGGEDFDARIIDWLIDEFREEAGIDLSEDRMALQRLKEASERAKAELSTGDEAEINLPFIAADDDGPRHLVRTLDRAHFESLVVDLVERTRAPCLDAMEQARLRPTDLAEVLLVGGQTRSPIVMATVEDVFDKIPNRELNPDEVVASGAAIQGAILSGDLDEVLLLDVTPLSLGVETRGGLFTKLIDRNATIPTKVSQVFSTTADNQDRVDIHILQGERRLASENRSLGHIVLPGIPAAPRGFPQIEVTFAIDSNSIHTVSAEDLDTGRSQSVQIETTSGLDEDEIERLVREAAEHAREDEERQEIQRLRVRLEGLIGSCEKVYKRYSGVLDSGRREEVREILGKARGALRSEHRNRLETAMFDLDQASLTLSQTMLDTAE